MAENKILPWAQTGTANVLSDADYAADVATGGLYGDGVKTGQASSQQANKTWRQATAPGAGLGQFIVDNLGVDVTDADTPSTFSTRIANAVLKLAQISPFNQSWATATGGYRKYAIVSDSSGNYWVSTADQNVTIPGANGAKWKSLFDGYATQSWVDGHYIRSPANPATDYRITIMSRNKTSGGIFAVAEDGSNTQLQPAGDYATNTALQAETQRAANIESNLQSSKANLSGGNSFTGDQSVSGAVASSSHSGSDAQGGLRWGGYLNSAITGSAANGNIYLAEIVGSEVYYDMQINYGSSRTDFTFHQNGSIESPKGMVAFQSEIPTAGTIPGGTYTKTPMNDGTGRSVLRQGFTVSGIHDGSVVTIPMALSGNPVSIVVAPNTTYSTGSDPSTGNWSSSQFSFHNAGDTAPSYSFIVEGIVS